MSETRDDPPRSDHERRGNDEMRSVDETIVDATVALPPETVETERVVVTEEISAAPGALAPPAPLPGEIVEEVGPRVVTEHERVRVEDDGSVTRRVDRVEQDPVVRRTRRPNVAVALLVILALALGGIAAAWYLTQSNTKTVPAVEGLALDDAVSRLQDDGFKADIVSQPNPAPQGTVFRQTPTAGSEEDEGSTVQLLASKGPATVTIPNAVGVAEVEARDRVAAAGLQVSVFRVFSEQPEGNVVAQSPAAGGKAAKGSAIRLNVSKGSGVTTIPSVVGTTQADAQAQLQAAGLKANVVPVPSQEVAGTVVAQNPVSGQAQKGSAVRLNVSTGP